MFHRKKAVIALSVWMGTAALAAPLELNKEYVPADEAKDMAKIVDLVKEGYKKEAEKLAEMQLKIAELEKTGKGDEAKALKKIFDKVRRDAHAKHHGCVRAKFEVAEDLPEKFQHGPFAYVDDKPQVYPAWVRFSNGDKQRKPDWVPGGRGMAIKLTQVCGKKLLPDEKFTQDFLMINFPEFFVRNAKDYVTFMELSEQGKPEQFFGHPDRRGTEGRIAFSIGNQFNASPLEAQYHSMVPIRLGNAAIKYSAKPCDDTKSTKAGDLDLAPLLKILSTVKKPEDFAAHTKELVPFEDFLGKALVHQNKERDYCFDFMVQFQSDAEKERIEDGTDAWKGEFHKVARVTILKDTLAPDEFCENLTITPWHATEALRPLGGIQRVRKDVYVVSSELRHKYNKAPVVEPTGTEFEKKK